MVSVGRHFTCWHLGTDREERNIQDGKMQQHTQRDCCDEVRVSPHRQAQETLVLRQRVHGVEHLDGHENRQTHRRRSVRHDVREHITANFGEFGRALVEVTLKMKD